jgi:hypothetical protein
MQAGRCIMTSQLDRDDGCSKCRQNPAIATGSMRNANTCSSLTVCLLLLLLLLLQIEHRCTKGGLTAAALHATSVPWPKGRRVGDVCAVLMLCSPCMRHQLHWPLPQVFQL